MNIITNLQRSFHNGEYQNFIRIFNSYLETGYGIDYEIIKMYITVLIKLRKFECAYRILRKIEDNNQSINVNNDLFHFYLFCVKPKDAERIYMTRPINVGIQYIIKMYLLDGKIEDAKRILDKCLSFDNNIELQSLKKQIDNYYNKGSFIEIAYSSFIEKGNKLEPGHIIYLKKAPASKCDISNDKKRNARPYMIWKIKQNVAFIFPVTTSNNQNRYKLYEQYYSNSVGDRSIKDNLCFISVNDILSISDKVLKQDFDVITKNIFYGNYYSNDSDQKIGNYQFMHEFHGQINIHDVIEYSDHTTKEKKYYFIVDILKEYYKIAEIDLNNLTIIQDKIEFYPKSEIIHRVIKLRDDEKKRLLEKINSQLLLGTFVGKKIATKDGNYIVISDNKDYCICVNDMNNLSSIRLFAIKKDEIESIYDIISKEEVNIIRGTIIKNNSVDLTKIMKKYK